VPVQSIERKLAAIFAATSRLLRRLRILDSGISQRLTGPEKREEWVQKGISTRCIQG